MTPVLSAKVLTSVPKCKKAVVCLPERGAMFSKPPGGLSCSAVGHEFNVNESIIHILNNVCLNRDIHKKRQDWLLISSEQSFIGT